MLVLDETNVKHVSKDKQKLNRIILPSWKFPLWEKNIFTFLPEITITAGKEL